MKRYVLFVILLLSIGTVTDVSALTLYGKIEHYAVIEPEAQPVQPQSQVIAAEPQPIEEKPKRKRQHKEGRIGVRISSSSGYVEYVHPSSPAQVAGIIKGDRIVRVDGRKHNVSNISGLHGTVVHLEIKRKDSESFALDVERISYDNILP